MFVQRFKSSIGCFYFFLMLNIIKTNKRKNESFCRMLFGPWYIFFFEGPAWPVYCGWTFVVLFLAWRWGNGKTRDDTAGEQTDTLTQQQMKVATRFPAFVSLLSFNHKTQCFLMGSNLHTFQLVMSVHPFSRTVYPALRVAAGRAITSDHSVTPTPSWRVASSAFLFCAIRNSEVFWQDPETLSC